MRNTISSMTIAALAATSLGLATAPKVFAQADSGSGAMMGHSTAMTASCPSIEWHIARLPPAGATPINGVAYFSDMSGVSIIKGMRAADGAITGTVTSVSGNGPAGVISGRHEKDRTDVALKGAGCSMTRMTAFRWAPYGAAGG